MFAKGVVAGLLLCAGSPSMAQSSPPPEMHMHRSQAGSLDASGWTVATSTEGAYSISVPCLFNDYTVEAKSETGAKSNLYMVGCDRSDSVRFSATRIEFPDDATGAQKMYDQYSRGGGPLPGSIASVGKFKGLPSVDVKFADGTKCAWLRLLHVGASDLMMIVEPINVPCSDLAATAAKFFDTAEVRAK